MRLQVAALTVTLALAAVATHPRVAQASTINLLNDGESAPGTADCVVLPERFGDLWLHFPELVWRLTTTDEGESALVCIDRHRPHGWLSSVGEFGGGGHGSGAGGAATGGGGGAGAFSDGQQTFDAPNMFMPVFDDFDSPGDGPDGPDPPQPFGTDDLPTLTSYDLFDPSLLSPDGPGGDGDSDPNGTGERATGLADPSDMADLAPVPEPGAWVLLGSGLAAAWRSSRRKG